MEDNKFEQAGREHQRKAQCCPVCNGTQTVPSGFYDPSIYQTLVFGQETCRSCNGTGVVWEPENHVSVEDTEEEGFVVECNVCGARYHNWSGSTPCCGSIAFIVDSETNKKTNDLSLFVLTNKTEE